jgi:hypothetical protein
VVRMEREKVTDDCGRGNGEFCGGGVEILILLN